MSSVKCPECNLTNWAAAENCKRCGHSLQGTGSEPGFVPPEPTEAPFDESVNFPPPSFSADDYQSNNQAAWQPPADQVLGDAPPNRRQARQNSRPANQAAPNYRNRQPITQTHRPADLKSGLAIASMVLGIFGFVTSIFLVGVLIAPIGLILGIVALVKANKKPNVYGGKGFAIAGVVTSSLVVLIIPIIAAIAIPNLLAARRAANESSAIAVLRTISAGEWTYMSTSGGNSCADLQTLGAQKLLDATAAMGERGGYRFTVTNLPGRNGGCEMRASPISASTGTRSFYLSTEDGTLRASSDGKLANRTDLPVK